MVFRSAKASFAPTPCVKNATADPNIACTLLSDSSRDVAKTCQTKIRPAWSGRRAGVMTPPLFPSRARFSRQFSRSLRITILKPGPE